MASHEYHAKTYWDARYHENPRFFDFYAQIPMFYQFFEPFLGTDPRILILGPGTSREPYQLYDKGFRSIVAVDFSKEARDAVQEHLHLRPEIDYQVADVADFRYGSPFDFIFDKGLLDCVLSDPSGPEERLHDVLSNIRVQMGPKSVWCSVTFDSSRDELIEEAMPGAFRIDRNDVKLEVYGIGAPQRVFCYVITRCGF